MARKDNTEITAMRICRAGVAFVGGRLVGQAGVEFSQQISWQIVRSLNVCEELLEEMVQEWNEGLHY